MGVKIQSDDEISEAARNQFRDMLLRKPWTERWEPVAKEWNSALMGRANGEQRQKILPDYCYNIFDLYQRTILKVVRPLSGVVVLKDEERGVACKTIEEAKQFMAIDFKGLGAVFGAGVRGLMFFENEMEGKLKQEGLLSLTCEEQDEIAKLLFGERWLDMKMAEFPGKTLDALLLEMLTKVAGTVKGAVPDWHQKAGEWGPEAVTKFHAGVAKGSAGFVNEGGELRGEAKLKHKDTYDFLLIAWPEIADMLRADPPETRNNLWNWIAPFSYAGWIEVDDLDKLNRLCDTIKLRLKSPGAPRKVK